ncbi:TPA: hypothetical protein ACXDAM_002264 [Clostridium botulinum]|nr:hypothetical protein [Clostridium botulinum]
MILMILIGVLLIIYLSCIVCKEEKQMLEECWYNILKNCKGKCCKECEIKNICKIACKENPDQCGGRINY